MLKTARTQRDHAADVKAIAPSLMMWRWWMDARPEEGLQCRADVFKGWHHR